MHQKSFNSFNNKIALFIPCYNEEKRFKIEKFQNFIKKYDQLIDFYFINDGSADSTIEIIRQQFTNDKNSFLIDLGRNLGKGNAIRAAILKNCDQSYEFYGFIDADLDIPLGQVVKLYEKLDNSSYSVAISRRDLYGSLNIYRFRSISSIIMLFIANRVIGINPGLKDTQCGCKLFKKEVVSLCFEEEFISEWLFDIEIFLRLKNATIDCRKIIYEVPLEKLGKSGVSKFLFFRNFKILFQLHKINKQYN